MSTPVDPASTAQQSSTTNPTSVSSIASTAQAMQAQTGTAVGSITTSTDPTLNTTDSTLDMNQTFGGTMGGLLQVPGSQQVVNLIMMGMELQIYDQLKQDEAHLEAMEAQHRQEEQDA